VGLARAFRRHVLAEGVETPEQAARLLELGCERAQGFGIARPMPASEVLGWANAYRRTWPPLPEGDTIAEAAPIAPHAQHFPTAPGQR
jgi:predicted signal transduction protein with EAL and GGDEF domain